MGQCSSEERYYEDQRTLTPPRWHFHSVVGANVALKNGGVTAVKVDNNEYKHCTVFSSLPLQSGDAFTVRVENTEESFREWFSVGLTTVDPDNTQLHDTAQKLRDSWIISTPGTLHKDGVKFSTFRTVNITSGDVLGVSWKHDAITLHLNGLTKFCWEVDGEAKGYTLPDKPWSEPPTSPVWAVLDMYDFSSITIVNMFPSGCELNRFVATLEWKKALNLPQFDRYLNSIDCYNKTPLEWVWKIPLTKFDKLAILEYLLDSGLELDFSQYNWKYMIEKSLVFNGNRYRGREPKNNLMQEKLIFLAYKVSARGFIELNTVFDLTLFSKLCMCRAGVKHRAFLLATLHQVINSIEMGDVSSVRGITMYEIILLTDPYILHRQFENQDLHELTEKLQDVLNLTGVRPIPTLYNLCLSLIRNILTSEPCGKSLVRMVSVLKTICPSQIIGNLSLDHLFGSEWKMNNFFLAIKFVTGLVYACTS